MTAALCTFKWIFALVGVGAPRGGYLFWLPTLLPHFGLIVMTLLTLTYEYVVSMTRSIAIVLPMCSLKLRV